MGLAVVLIGQPASAADAAADFLRALADESLNQLSDDEVSEEVRESRFRSLFRANFDVPGIGRFVVARYWRGASEEQRANFLAAFEDVLVQRFLPLFRDKVGPELDFGREVRDTARPKLVIVTSVIRTPGDEPFKVDWRLTEKDDQFRILDVVGEGVSLAITYRQEYASVLSKAGGNVDALTDRLREMVDSGAFAPR